MTSSIGVPAMLDLAWASAHAAGTSLIALDWREQRVLTSVFSALREGRNEVAVDATKLAAIRQKLGTVQQAPSFLSKVVILALKLFRIRVASRAVRNAASAVLRATAQEKIQSVLSEIPEQQFRQGFESMGRNITALCSVSSGLFDRDYRSPGFRLHVIDGTNVFDGSADLLEGQTAEDRLQIHKEKIEAPFREEGKWIPLAQALATQRSLTSFAAAVLNPLNDMEIKVGDSESFYCGVRDAEAKKVSLTVHRDSAGRTIQSIKCETSETFPLRIGLRGWGEPFTDVGRIEIHLAFTASLDDSGKPIFSDPTYDYSLRPEQALL